MGRPVFALRARWRAAAPAPPFDLYSRLLSGPEVHGWRRETVVGCACPTPAPAAVALRDETRAAKGGKKLPFAIEVPMRGAGLGLVFKYSGGLPRGHCDGSLHLLEHATIHTPHSLRGVGSSRWMAQMNTRKMDCGEQKVKLRPGFEPGISSLLVMRYTAKPPELYMLIIVYITYIWCLECRSRGSQ